MSKLFDSVILCADAVNENIDGSVRPIYASLFREADRLQELRK
jgi:hypothetical protein